MAQILERIGHVKKTGADPDLRDVVRALPKYEFHVHLGGSIRRETAADLAAKNGVALPAAKKHFLKAASPLEFFHGDELWELFHNTYKWYWSCVRGCRDIERIVAEFLEDSHRQGVVHSEFTVSGSYLMNAFPLDEWADAVRSGIDEAGKHFGIRAAAILDISRRAGPEGALNIVRQFAGRRPPAICGIGMGGDEVKYPHRLFSEAFSLARESGIRTTVHVAEFAAGETTIEALEILRPDRLGHALNTHKSVEGFEALKKSGKHVESCPVCNYVATMGEIGHLSHHPVKRYFDDGIPVSINTDDPSVFGYDLIDCYVCMIKDAGFSVKDLEKINTDAQNHAFIKE